MRFTDKGIVALKPKAERYEVWEDGKTGLGVRVSTRGRKSWIYMYRFGGRARRMTIGTYPPLTLANARVLQAKAKESKDQVGGDDVPGIELAARLSIGRPEGFGGGGKAHHGKQRDQQKAEGARQSAGLVLRHNFERRLGSTARGPIARRPMAWRSFAHADLLHHLSSNIRFSMHLLET